MPKVLNTGDWQLDAYPAHDKFDELGRSIRFRENVEAIRRLLQAGWDKGCRVLVHNGDLTEHKNPKSVEIEGAAELFRFWIDLGGTVVAAAGNHDGANYVMSSSSFAGLAIMAGKAFRVAHEITYYEDLNLVVLPYLHNKNLQQVTEAHAAVRRKIKGPKAPWLVAHYGVQNCVVGAYNLTIPSDMLGAEQVFPDGLPYGAVFCGHIHKQQVVPMMNGADPVDIVFPGSPFPVDFGERNDPKGYAIYDTETNRYELFQTVPDREWVQVELGDGSQDVTAAWSPPSWSAGAILKFSGRYAGKVHPRFAFAAAVKKGELPEPFCFPDFKEVKPVAQGRVGRGAEYSKIASLREAAAAYVTDKFKDKPGEQLRKILELVTDAVEDMNKAAVAPFLQPIRIEAKNITTFKELAYSFEAEVPTLLVGGNGVGKTNFMDLALFAITGMTLKKLKLSSMLRRGAKDGMVRLVLGHADLLFIVTRTLKRTAQGVTHKLSISYEDPNTGGPVDWGDGGGKDMQDSLNKAMCTPFELVRTVNFMFQRWHDPEALVMIEPLARKKVITEILGLGPLTVALKRLTELRLARAKTLEAEKNKLLGIATMFNPADGFHLERQVLETRQELDRAESVRKVKAEALNVADGQVKAQERVLDEARKAIQALPDTGAALAAAQAALGAENASYERAYPTAKDRWRTLDQEVKTLTDRVAKQNSQAWEQSLARAREAAAGSTQEVQRLTGLVAEAETEHRTQSRHSLLLVEQAQKLAGENITNCPACGQKVDRSHVQAEFDKVVKEREALLPVIDGLAAKITELKGQKQAEAGRLTVYEGEVRNAQSILEDDRRTRDALELKKTELQACIDSGVKLKADHEKAVAELTDKIKDAQAKHDQGQAQREQLQAKETQERGLLDNCRRERDLVQQHYGAADAALQTATQSHRHAQENLAKHQELAERVKQAEAAKVLAEAEHEIAIYACEALDPKTGLPIYLVDSRLQYIEERMNDYMLTLGRPDLRLQLTTQDGDKETLAVLVDDGNEERLDIRAYSGGQGTRMELAFKLALADLVADSRESHIGMFLLDEPDKDLDEAGKQALIELLHDRARNGWPAVVVITHDEKLLGAFSRRLTAEAGPEGETMLVSR